MHENEIGKFVVDCALTVHKNLRPGLLESTYQACLAHELKKEGLFVDKETALPVFYKDVMLECGYRIDLWIERKVILEIKSVDALNDIYMAQILTYLKLSNNKLGFLFNFYVAKSEHGIRRVVNNL